MQQIIEIGYYNEIKHFTCIISVLIFVFILDINNFKYISSQVLKTNHFLLIPFLILNNDIYRVKSQMSKKNVGDNNGLSTKSS